jgi:PKD repeat protein
MARALRALILLAAAAAAATACRVKDTPAPPLSGPSELGLSLTIQASPDTLTQDGSSQSTLSVLARDAAGQPVRNVTCRIDIALDGALADFGKLSSRTVTTGSDGRAVVVYTAPPASPVATTDTVVSLVVTPIGTDFSNAFGRSVTLRLVPAGVITPPGGVAAFFTFTPTAPAELDQVTFAVKFCTGSETTGCTPTGGTGYSWTFGDGGTASGTSAVHQYTSAGNYSVTLTVTDSRGFPSSSTQTVIVKAGTAPTASFTLTPSSPKALVDAILDGSASTAAAGRRIVSYDWNFGDATPPKHTTVAFTNHDWGVAGTFAVTLTVTDDAGRTGTKILVVTVTP